MSFTPDSKELVASYGNKIWRVAVDGSGQMEIPFHVQATVAAGPELAFQLSDQRQRASSPCARSATPCRQPDGRQLAFVALDRLYVMDWPGGTPRRVSTLDAIEAEPAWSPDSRSLAWVTWTDEGGRLYKAAGRTGQPRRAAEPGLTPSASRRGPPRARASWPLRTAAQGRRDQTGRDRAHGHRVVSGHARRRADGSDAHDHRAAPSVAARRTSRATPSRILPVVRAPASSPSAGTAAMSRRTCASPAPVAAGGVDDDDDYGADATAPTSRNSTAPLGRRARLAGTAGVAHAHVPHRRPRARAGEPGLLHRGGAAARHQRHRERGRLRPRAALPVRQLTDIGGQFPAWSADGRRVHWSIGNAHVVFDLDSAAARTP